MAKKKIIGYILLGQQGTGYATYRTAPYEDTKEHRGLIWTACMGQPTTVFRSREAAQKALSRTIKFGRKHKFAWESWLKDARIEALVRA